MALDFSFELWGFETSGRALASSRVLASGRKLASNSRIQSEIPGQGLSCRVRMAFGFEAILGYEITPPERNLGVRATFRRQNKLWFRTLGVKMDIDLELCEPGQT